MLPRLYLIVLYVLFLIISLIVMLNLLIAMMSTTYEVITARAVVEFRHMTARRVLRSPEGGCSAAPESAQPGW